MEVIYRSAASASGAGSPSTRSGTGTLSGLWSGTFGNRAQPGYRHGTRIASSAEESRCWWRPFAVTPQYKTLPPDEPDECGDETPPECDDEDVLVECQTVCW